MMEPIIRYADAGESGCIATLMQNVYNNMQDKTWFVCDDEEYVKKHISDEGFCVVALSDERIVGSLVARYPKMSQDNLGKEMEALENELEYVAHIESMVVDEAFRGHGLQRKMMEFAIKEIDKNTYRHIMGTVAPKNTPSLNNFLKLGFSVVKTVEKYGGLERHILYKKNN